MKIRLEFPAVNQDPLDRPCVCPYCKGNSLHRHQTLTKPVRDHQVRLVVVHRYKCVSCKRTFRQYPAGVDKRHQSQRTVVMAGVMYGLGLSVSASSHLLRALGVPIGKTTVWQDAQVAGRVLRRTRPKGVVRAIGADETVFGVRGDEVVGFVTDAASGEMLGFDVLARGDGQAFVEWLRPYVHEYGVEVVVTDDNSSYSVATGQMELEHQLCVTHVRKYVRRRAHNIVEKAEEEWGVSDPRTKQLQEDLTKLREVVAELDVGGVAQVEALHRKYVGYPHPRHTRTDACAGYRMRMLTLELWEKWSKLRMYKQRAELGLDGTDNCTERCIGKSKVRYKTMRGYKSIDGMKSGITLTQWLYSGKDSHALDLAA